MIFFKVDDAPTWMGIEATRAASTPKMMLVSPPHLKSISIII